MQYSLKAPFAVTSHILCIPEEAWLGKMMVMVRIITEKSDKTRAADLKTKLWVSGGLSGDIMVITNCLSIEVVVC